MVLTLEQLLFFKVNNYSLSPAILHSTSGLILQRLKRVLFERAQVIVALNPTMIP